MTRSMKFFMLLATLHTAYAQHQLTIRNKCPSDITYYISGASRGSLRANGGQARTTVSDRFSGVIYTDANGGNSDGSDTTRAGFNLQNDYYYMVVDQTHFNTAVSISPSTKTPRKNGFCPVVRCGDASCSQAFRRPPTSFPRPSSLAPSPPLYRCPGRTDYVVTFCPDNKFPPQPTNRYQRIHPNGNVNKCLDVRGNIQQNGTPVQIYDCNGTGAQNWEIRRGNTMVRLAGTNFCLDAGSTPGNGVGMKIWQCYDNLPAQEWSLTRDNRITLRNQGFCLDLKGGSLVNGNQVQTWMCRDNNNNQVWTRSS